MSKYNLDETLSMKGLQAKITFTFSVASVMSALFITVCGLNDLEMNDSNCLLVSIKGLRMGGRGININDTTEGHILFIKKQKDADLVKSRHYQDKVLLPFLAENRYQVYHNSKKIHVSLNCSLLSAGVMEISNRYRQL